MLSYANISQANNFVKKRTIGKKVIFEQAFEMALGNEVALKLEPGDETESEHQEFTIIEQIDS